MKTKIRNLIGATISALLINTTLFADGTETLGPASIPISPGTGILAAGTGLFTQPNTINLTVPAGSTVEQVILYWEGDNFVEGSQGAPDTTIIVNGIEVTGTIIGGPEPFFGAVTFTAFRADITALGLISVGANTLTVEGLANNYANNGAGVLVIVDDGGTLSHIDIRDGLDLAFFNFQPLRDKVVPQTFIFAAEDGARTATLSMFFASVGVNRPNEIKVTIGGATTTYPNLLNANDGDEWDTVNLSLTIPAGVTSVTVEAISVPSEDPLGASFAWIGAGFSVSITPDEEPPTNPGTGTPGYWKNHPEAWPISSITIGGITYTRDQAIAVMKKPTKGDKTLNMFEQLVSSILNVLIGNDPSCIDSTIDAALGWMAAHPAGSGVKASSAAWSEGGPLHSTLDTYNNGLLCAPHRD